MLETSPVQGVISTKDNKDSNKYSYISTYSMGNIGIKKIIEEDSLKNPISSDNNNNNNNNILLQSFPINNITNITSNNTNNTNTNTNSNSNNNSSKNKDTQTSKKILKNKHSVSPNSTHIYTQTASNSKYYYYKSKTNQRLNIIKKNNINLKPTLTQIKLPKKEYSKTANNFYIYTTNNIYNKNKNNNNYSKKKNKSKSNTKLIKERKIIDGPIKPLSSHTSCIFSPMTPSSIKRQKKYYMSNIISNTKIETDINSNIISFKRDISEKYLRCNNNNSSTDIQNNRKLQLNNETKNNLSNNRTHNDIKKSRESKYQMTEGNINYLRVRKRSDLHTNSNINNNIDNDNNLKIQSTPVLITDTSNIKLSSSQASRILTEDMKNEIIMNNKLINFSEKNINTNPNIPSTAKCTNTNSMHNNSIPKLFLNDNNNINKLYPEKIRNSDANKNHMNIDISNISHEKKSENDNEIKKIKNKDRDKDKDKVNNREKNVSQKPLNTTNKNMYNNMNINTSKNYSNYSFNKTKKYIKNNNNNKNYDAFLKRRKKEYNNIKSVKDVKNEENKNSKNNKNNKNNRDKKKYYSSYSRNKNKSKNKNNISLSRYKKSVLSHHNKYRAIQMQSNRNKSSENQLYKNKVKDINKKMKDNNICKKEENNEGLNFDCPEELHYFLVNLTINYRCLNENY